MLIGDVEAYRKEPEKYKKIYEEYYSQLTPEEKARINNITWPDYDENEDEDDLDEI